MTMTRPYQRRPPAPPSAAALEASAAFQMPAPDPAPAPELAEPDRCALVTRILAHPGDWRRIALVLLDTRGPDAFTTEALVTLTRIVEAIEHKPNAKL